MLGPLPTAHCAGLLLVSAVVGAVLGSCVALLGAAGTSEALAMVTPGQGALLGALALGALATFVLIGVPRRHDV